MGRARGNSLAAATDKFAVAFGDGRGHGDRRGRQRQALDEIAQLDLATLVADPRYAEKLLAQYTAMQRPETVAALSRRLAGAYSQSALQSWTAMLEPTFTSFAVSDLEREQFVADVHAQLLWSLQETDWGRTNQDGAALSELSDLAVVEPLERALTKRVQAEPELFLRRGTATYSAVAALAQYTNVPVMELMSRMPREDAAVCVRRFMRPVWSAQPFNSALPADARGQLYHCPEREQELCTALSEELLFIALRDGDARVDPVEDLNWSQPSANTNRYQLPNGWVVKQTRRGDWNCLNEQHRPQFRGKSFAAVAAQIPFTVQAANTKPVGDPVETS